MLKYIVAPKTVEEYKYNAIFQACDVQGWLLASDYEAALIKAHMLVEDLEALVAAQSAQALHSPLDNVRQSLTEIISDFLDSEEIATEESFARLKDPQKREETDLHIRMADAAFHVYKSTIVPA